LLDKVIRLLLQQRQDAKTRKDYAASDQIRQQLTALGIMVKDTRDGAEWEIE
jgi:cysteinyl-tRNA synthetase